MKQFIRFHRGFIYYFFVSYLPYLTTMTSGEYSRSFHNLFITSCLMFRLIKAFIKKGFLSMSHSLHTAYAHHFVCNKVYVTKTLRK